MQVIPLQRLGGKVDHCVFDDANPHLFLVADARTWNVCLFEPVTVSGPSAQVICSMDAIPDSVPLLLHDGEVVLQLSTGQLSSLELDCFRVLKANGTSVAHDSNRTRFTCAPSEVMPCSS